MGLFLFGILPQKREDNDRHKRQEFSSYKYISPPPLLYIHPVHIAAL
ncbi:hypothetical protein PORCAN_1061 [Porphyromonas crevioricanis JCM 13913]|nr:hypothetical protein PORCAN_1061 [Porphyromonas crevioricanis JCM 13913]